MAHTIARGGVEGVQYRIYLPMIRLLPFFNSSAILTLLPGEPSMSSTLGSGRLRCSRPSGGQARGRDGAERTWLQLGSRIPIANGQHGSSGGSSEL
jgi:hypothetical protein